MAAVKFCEDLFRISQIWDDLIDRDREVPNTFINQMMWKALVDVPQNPFYYNNATSLSKIIELHIIDWFDANELEQGSDHDKNMAFVLRDSIGTIVIHCAKIIGGYDWMRSISTEVRRYVYDEPLEAYKEALPGST